MFEPLQYDDNLPVNVKICSVKEYPLHYNADIQLLYVMKGSVDLKLTCNIYHVEENDIHFIHVNDIHGITAASENNIIIVVSLNTKALQEKYPDLQDQIFTTKIGKNLIAYQKMIELRNDIFTILSEFYKKNQGYVARMIC